MSFGETQFRHRFEMATRRSLKHPDWESVHKLCSLINERRCTAAYAFNVIRKKLPDGEVSILTAQILETIVRACGCHAVYKELSENSFLFELRDIYRTNEDDFTLKKLKELLQTWAKAFEGFPSYGNVKRMIELMESEGVVFPSVTLQDVKNRMFRKPPEWSNQKFCFQCNMSVGWLTRHHCRACGQVFCLKCSKRKADLPQFGFDGKVRVCDACFENTSGYDSKSNSGEVQVQDTQL